MVRILLIVGVVSVIAGTIIYFRFFNQKDKTVETEAPSVDVSQAVDLSQLEQEAQKISTSSALPTIKPFPKTTNVNSRISALENAVLILQSQVAILKNQSPGPTTTTTQVASTTKYPLYIPLGAGGQAGDKGWFALNQYQISIDPGQYSGYTSMQLEVNYRLLQKSGTAHARLYNATDNTAISTSEVTTTSDEFSLVTSGGFTLTSGNKIYKLQIKSIEGVEIQLESARIKVNF